MKETGAAEWVANLAITGLGSVVQNVDALHWFISVFFNWSF